MRVLRKILHFSAETETIATAEIKTTKALAETTKAAETPATVVTVNLASKPAQPELLPAPKMVKHHIFNKFRGESPASQKYRDFFTKHSIDVDNYTVSIPETLHRTQIHKAEKNWTTEWKRWIDKNPNAETQKVYQFGGVLMDRYNINHLPLIPYK
jgi:hypothetical protein